MKSIKSMSKQNKTISKTILKKLSQKRKKSVGSRLSKKKLTDMLQACSALINRTGELFTLTKSSQNIFEITSVQSGKSLIYYKKDARFSDGLIKLCCGIDACQDYYKILIPIQSIR